MPWRLACCVGSLLTGCGRVGVELLPVDGGRDASDLPLTDGALADDGEAPRDDGGDASACATPCENAHGSARCSGDRCEIGCDPGYDDCDGDPGNGCEAALDSIEHCTRCGVACESGPGSTASCVGGACRQDCDRLTGVYGLRMTIPTTWSATLFTSSGRGNFELWARVQLTQTGLALAGTMSACGRVVPDFEPPPVFPERYGVSYPDALFERTLPITRLSGTLATSAPGASVTFSQAALVLGVALADPVASPWPSLTQIEATDDDGDGARGVMAQYKSGNGYSFIPLNPFATARAAEGDYALRIRFTLSGAFTSCGSVSGSAATPEVDVRVVGCRLTTSATCSASQYEYLDENEPAYQEQASSFVLYRLGELNDPISCADVRAVLP